MSVCVHCIWPYNADGQNESRREAQKMREERQKPEEGKTMQRGWVTCQLESKPYHFKKRVKEKACIPVCLSGWEENELLAELNLNWYYLSANAHRCVWPMALLLWGELPTICREARLILFVVNDIRELVSRFVYKCWNIYFLLSHSFHEHPAKKKKSR